MQSEQTRREPDLEKVIDIFVEAAQEIAHVQVEKQRFAIDLHKGPDAIKGALSQYDPVCQSIFIAAAIKFGLHQSCGLIAEEDTSMVPYFNSQSKFKLVIDPIDGTRNYIAQKPEFGTSMGLLEGDRFVAGLVYSPALGVMFCATEGKGTYLVDADTLEKERVTLGDKKDMHFWMAHLGYKVSSDAESKMNSDGIRTRRPICAVYSISSLLLRKANTFSPMDAYIWDLGPGILAIKEAGGYCTQQEWPRKEEKIQLCVLADSQRNADATLRYIKPTGGA